MQSQKLCWTLHDIVGNTIHARYVCTRFSFENFYHSNIFLCPLINLNKPFVVFVTSMPKTCFRIGDEKGGRSGHRKHRYFVWPKPNVWHVYQSPVIKCALWLMKKSKTLCWKTFIRQSMHVHDLKSLNSWSLIKVFPTQMMTKFAVSRMLASLSYIRLYSTIIRDCSLRFLLIWQNGTCVLVQL